ncbi:hypothetical protein [Niabella hibiscisoli]|nr:hypothetical protein [Niabella hibiscisoli]
MLAGNIELVGTVQTSWNKQALTIVNIVNATQDHEIMAFDLFR